MYKFLKYTFLIKYINFTYINNYCGHHFLVIFLKMASLRICKFVANYSILTIWYLILHFNEFFIIFSNKMRKKIAFLYWWNTVLIIESGVDRKVRFSEMRVLIIRKIVANRNELYFSDRFNSLINRTTQCTKLIYWQNIDKLKKVTTQCRQPQRVALQLTFYFVDILNSESTNLVIQRISMKQQQFYFF